MALKAFYKTQAEIPDALKALYVESGGMWVLDAEIEDHPTVAGLKSTVIATRRERDEAVNRFKVFEDLDLDVVEEALERQAALEEGELLEAGDIDSIVANRTEAMRTEFQKTLDALTGQNKGMTDRLRTLTIDAGLTKLASTLGIRPEAMDDFQARGRSVFTLDENGNMVAKDRDGNVIYGKNGKDPMTMDEWGANVAPNIQHLLLPSGGAGARNADGRTVVTGLKVVDRNDSAAFNANLEAIAKGEVKVQ